MTQHSTNPFQSQQIISPIRQRTDYDLYCQSGQVRSRTEECPFPRKVDLWFAGIALALRNNLNPIDLTKEETVNIISGEIFNTDGWQAQAIMLIAIELEGDLDIVLKPRIMMNKANGLAAAGVPYIVKMLNEGSHKPIWNLSEEIEKLMQSDPVTEEQSDQARLAEALL